MKIETNITVENKGKIIRIERIDEDKREKIMKTNVYFLLIFALEIILKPIW